MESPLEAKPKDHETMEVTDTDDEVMEPPKTTSQAVPELHTLEGNQVSFSDTLLATPSGLVVSTALLCVVQEKGTRPQAPPGVLAPKAMREHLEFAEKWGYSGALSIQHPDDTATETKYNLTIASTIAFINWTFDHEDKFAGCMARYVLTDDESRCQPFAIQGVPVGSMEAIEQTIIPCLITNVTVTAKNSEGKKEKLVIPIFTTSHVADKDQIPKMLAEVAEDDEMVVSFRIVPTEETAVKLTMSTTNARQFLDKIDLRKISFTKLADSAESCQLAKNILKAFCQPAMEPPPEKLQIGPTAAFQFKTISRLYCPQPGKITVVTNGCPNTFPCTESEATAAVDIWMAH